MRLRAPLLGLIAIAGAAAPCSLSVSLWGAEEFFDITVDPPAGSLQTTFLFKITNRTSASVQFHACYTPKVTAVLDGSTVLCPPQPAPECDPSELLPGDSWQYQWKPLETICAGTPIPPGLYQVEHDEFPLSAMARLEIFPEDSLRLAMTATPAAVRLGETARISLENTSGVDLQFDHCCFPPAVLDSGGHGDFCPVCNRCVAPTILAAGEKLDFDWTAGDARCDDTEPSLPGVYRVIWSRLHTVPTDVDPGIIHTGETTVKVLPAADYEVELSLSGDTLHAGDSLKVTATNRLGVSVFLSRCCDSVIFIDEMGRRSPCEPCALDCDVIRDEELPPDGAIDIDATIPSSASDGCGLRPGRWTVIWGLNFGLQDGEDPVQPVLGAAEITVLPEGGTEPAFLRGNCDGLGQIDITDPVFLLTRLFIGGVEPPCPDACDFDDGGSLDITDAVNLLNYLFLGSAPPVSPFPDPGVDPTQDGLGACR